MAQIYYFQEEQLPNWMTPIWEMHKLNRNFYNEFIQFLEDNNYVTDPAILTLVQITFETYQSAHPDEETIRDVLRRVETYNPPVLDSATRSTLVALAVTYAQQMLATKITEIQAIIDETYSVPNDIGQTHDDGN